MLPSESGAGSDNRDGAIRIIAINPKLRAECEVLLPALERAKEAATDEEVVTIIARAMPAWGVSAKHAAEWGVTYAAYVEALDGLSIHAIEEGVLRWNRGEGQKDMTASGFPPRPAQLYALASDAKREVFTAAYRARKALEYVEKKAPDWSPERKAEERRKMIELGYLNPDGTPNLNLKPKSIPSDSAPRRSPQEVAASLRAAAGGDEDVL